MACRYTYQGKTFEAHEFDDVLKSLPPAVAAKYIPSIKSTPDAPFIGKDPKPIISLALKRMIRYAVDGGFDRIAMVTGEQSAERYDLSKQVSSVEVTPYKSYRSIMIEHSGGSIPINVNNDALITSGSRELVGKQLDEVVGKDLASRLMKSERRETLSGDGLKFGGEGMKAFYDKIVPNVANDVLKKLGGGKVGTVSIEAGKRPISYDLIKEPNHPRPWFVRDIRVRGHADVIARFATAEEARAKIAELDGKSQDMLTQPGFDITDKMREHAEQGMPLFQRARPTRATLSTAEDGTPQIDGDTITRESFGASPAGKNAGTDSGGARIAESQDRRAITAKRNPALSTPPETTALLRRLSVLESIRTCLG